MEAIGCLPPVLFLLGVSLSISGIANSNPGEFWGGAGILGAMYALYKWNDERSKPSPEDEAKAQAEYQAAMRQRAETKAREVANEKALAAELAGAVSRFQLHETEIRALLRSTPDGASRDPEAVLRALRSFVRELDANGGRLAVTNWQEAERAAMRWLRQNGHPEARLTGNGADAGLDVIADQGAAQVKWTAAKVGRPAIQNLKGAAGRRMPYFFARHSAQGAYSTAAVTWAREHRVTLLTIDQRGEVRSVT